MTKRFRYTSPDGVEVEVRDLDGLRAHVSRGRVRDDTPLLDRLTGEHAPAASHEAYRFVVELASEDGALPPPASREGPEPAGDPPRSSGEQAAPAGDPSTRRRAERDFPDVEVTLTEPGIPDVTAEVVERLRKEQEEDRERHSTGERPAPSMVDGASGTFTLGDVTKDPGGSWTDPGEVTPMSDEVPVGSAAPSAPGGPASDAGISGGEPSSAEGGAAAPSRGRRPGRRSRGRPTRLRRGGSGARRFALRGFSGDRTFYLVGALSILVAAAAWLTLEAGVGEVGGPVAMDAAPAVDVEAHLDLAPRGAASRLAESEGIAFQHMVEGMDSLARVHRVFNVPAVWLEGRYLANAAAHSEVEAYWQRYLRFVRDLRSEDVALFRRSFVSRMESLDVAQSVASLRLAQALRRFDASQPLREDMYDHMEDLALAGLELHDLMVRRAVDIRYTPATRASAVRDPFLEVYIEDEELQGRIYELIDRILEDLEALHGETRWTRDRLNQGVLQGIRSTGERGTDAP